MTKKEIIEACKVRLLCLGFDTTNILHFNTFINYAINKVENHIKNYCNISKIPDGLYELLVDGVCGELLKTLKDSNLLNAENFDLDTAVKSITEGDVSVTYAVNEGSATDEQKLTALINSLADIDKNCLTRYRRLNW